MANGYLSFVIVSDLFFETIETHDDESADVANGDAASEETRTNNSIARYTHSSRHRSRRRSLVHRAPLSPFARSLAFVTNPDASLTRAASSLTSIAGSHPGRTDRDRTPRRRRRG